MKRLEDQQRAALAEAAAHTRSIAKSIQDVISNSNIPTTAVFSTQQQSSDIAAKAEHWINKFDAESREYKVIHSAGTSPEHAKPNYDGKKGSDGAHGKRGEHATDPGEDGQDGEDGLEGQDGTDGGDADDFEVRLQLKNNDNGIRTYTVETVDGSAKSEMEEFSIPWSEDAMIILDGKGGKGGEGGRGGDGGGKLHVSLLRSNVSESTQGNIPLRYDEMGFGACQPGHFLCFELTFNLADDGLHACTHTHTHTHTNPSACFSWRQRVQRTTRRQWW